jgi:ATP-dependent helicase/nuclease subunit A
LQTRVLVDLVKKFDGLYGHTKRTLNCLDFADLEHYALRLLTDEDSTEDKPEPSETALMLREKYKHIFVDEYQDINSVQQRILQMLSPGGNILEVGDVKQSIYAFRGAQPDIFLQQLELARRGGLASAEPENVARGLRVDLNVNFRSAKGILDFVNRIFSRIMTPSFTKIDYDESAQLKPALTDEPKDRPVSDNQAVVEFHILDEVGKDNDAQDKKSSESKDEGNLNLVSSRQRQAVMIARRIRQMVGTDTGRPEFQIFDKQQDTFRDVQYSDIVVLMRSLAKKANDYVEVLRLAGVPVSCQATAGYFQATEISDVLCLLKVLDNPQRDIELAAVLRSPFFKVSDTELAKIKIYSRESQQRRNYYDCVLRYCGDGTDAKLAAKLKGIIAQIEQWRTIARRGNLADLVWQVYRETGFLSFVSALPNGQARRANLLKLHDRAIQFEGFVSSAGIPSLTRFVDFLERLQETGQDWAPAEPQSSAGNAVRILSVHKSKGLEFPVVFLAELESPFNKTDIQADILTDADDTLGLQIIDRQSNSKLSSLAHEVIAEQKLSTALAEEMRILYVATTRARDRLILSASEKEKHCRDIITNGYWLNPSAKDQSPITNHHSPITKSIPDWQLRSCRDSLEWVLYALSDQRSLHSAFGTGLAEQAIDDDLFRFELYDQAQLKQLSEFVLKLKTDRSLAPPPVGGARLAPTSVVGVRGLLAQVKKSLAWRYRFGDAYILPAKTSVTQLTHHNDEYIKFDYSRALDRQPAALISAEPALTEAIEPRLLGIATHLVISQLDLAGSITEEAIEKTKDKLLAGNAITASVAENINIGSIMTFFESELGKMAFEAENTVLREWPFTFALPASEWKDFYILRNTQSAIRDTIIIQGIIDMLVRTPKGLVIIDFKTDNVTPAQVRERAELYRRQLDLYSRAASAILKDKLLAKWLYFLMPVCAIEVE